MAHDINANNPDSSNIPPDKVYGAGSTESDGLTIKEFARLTGKSYTTIRSMVAESGEIPADIVGKGGKNSPKYKINSNQVALFNETPKLMGRPRKGSSPPQPAKGGKTYY